MLRHFESEGLAMVGLWTRSSQRRQSFRLRRRKDEWRSSSAMHFISVPLVAHPSHFVLDSPANVAWQRP